MHNWIDTGGLRQVLVQNRNQGLPREVLTAGTGVTLDCRLVALSDLRRVLPADTRWVTPVERRDQIAERQAQLQRRFVDH